jgi:hypothetical protein
MLFFIVQGLNLPDIFSISKLFFKNSCRSCIDVPRPLPGDNRIRSYKTFVYETLGKYVIISFTEVVVIYFVKLVFVSFLFFCGMLNKFIRKTIVTDRLLFIQLC